MKRTKSGNGSLAGWVVAAAFVVSAAGVEPARGYDVYEYDQATLESWGDPDIYQCRPGAPAVVQLHNAVRDSLDKVYTNLAVLLSKGFFPYYDVPVAVLTRYSHWLNPWYFDTGLGMDPLRPQSVLVNPWGKPIGFMFIEDIDTPDDSPSRILYEVRSNGDLVEQCSPWHGHADAAARSFFTYYRILWKGDATPPSETPQMVHVWYDNPLGIFDHNPPPGPLSPSSPPLPWKCTDQMREWGFPCSPGTP